MGRDPRHESKSVPPILELDDVFEAIAHPYRRYLLYALGEDGDRSLDDVASEICAWENREADSAAEDAEGVYVSLYHIHVPMLAEADVVEFDAAIEELRPGPNAEQALTVLASAGGSGDSKLEHHARTDHNEGWI